MIISDSLSIPPDAVTETFAILGRRGSGKTHTASVMCEQMLTEKLQVAVIDPLDVWWGLRSSSDGKRAGFAVVVFGGEHADLPLEAEHGALFAELVVQHGINAVFSVRHLSKEGARRFVADFGEKLYRLKGSTGQRTPLHLYVDEADAFVPQKLFPGTERCFGAIDTIVRRGRSSGLGTTLISQRAAVINKDVLTQTEIMISHQTTSPQDRKALEAWVDANGTAESKREFMTSLATLKKGEAWFWSPAWLEIFKRMKVNPRETFDSSSTPKVGQLARTPSKQATINVDGLRKLIEAATAPAKAPVGSSSIAVGQLTKAHDRIAELELQLKEQPRRILADLATIDVRLNGILDEVRKLSRFTSDVRLSMPGAVEHAVKTKDSDRTLPATPATAMDLGPPRSSGPPTARPALKPLGEFVNVAATRELPKDGRLRLVTVLAQAGGALSRAELAIRSLYNPSGGGFRKALSMLRLHGAVTEDGDVIKLATKIGAAEPPILGAELRALWLDHVPVPAQRILTALADTGITGVSRRELAARCNPPYEVSGGGFRKALSVLRKAGAVIENGDNVRLHRDLQ